MVQAANGIITTIAGTGESNADQGAWTSSVCHSSVVIEAFLLWSSACCTHCPVLPV